jgi:hypothetical protein
VEWGAALWWNFVSRHSRDGAGMCSDACMLEVCAELAMLQRSAAGRRQNLMVCQSTTVGLDYGVGNRVWEREGE